MSLGPACLQHGGMSTGRGSFPFDAADESTAQTLPTITVTPPPLIDDGFDDRYAIKKLLGRGGMGEVFLARDQRIGREVALKAARMDGTEEVGQRFSRECRLQGQLEHPGLVPVYDVGKMPDGAPFFTMKRVRGVTLEEVLAGLAKGDAQLRGRFSRRRLLSIFGTICQTIQFAHKRGVVHRDLKPANVMLGDFGEIYVLDWGVAKVVASDTDLEPASQRGPSQPPETEEVATSYGALLGTLGYMAPEQLENAASVDGRADVYSLGAILLELLTGERLHPAERAVDLAGSTMVAQDKRIRQVCSERVIPLELCELCVRATHPSQAARVSSAEELVAAIERFLDGDRDLEARAKLAELESQAAMSALEQVDDEALPSSARASARAKALRRAGRALALDPSQSMAQDVVLRMMVWAPPEAEEPVQVAEETERRFARAYQRGALAGVLLYATWLPLALAILLSGPVDSGPVFTWIGSLLVAICALAFNARTPSRHAGLYFFALVTCMAACFAASRIVGPYLTVPGVVTMTVMVFILLGKPAWHPAALAIGVAGLLLPVLAERLHWVEVTTTFDQVGMHVSSGSVRLDPSIAPFGLAAGMVALLAVLGLAARWVQKLLLESAQKAALEAWKLGSLVPRASGEGTPPSSRL